MQIWNTTGKKLHPQVLKYTVGDDYILDQKVFLPYDLQASLAHAEMLAKIKILTGAEFAQVKKGLTEIKRLWEKGEFIITQEQEDCHAAIEQYLTKHFGACGEKIHTSRSRNDQSLAMIRLYEIDQLHVLRRLVNSLSIAWQKWIKIHGKIQMPGYTHMQKAMPTTVGTWQGCYLDAMRDADELLDEVLELLDQSPLGSGAGYELPIKIDRQFTAKRLGFSRVQENPIYCQLSRGLFEGQVLNAAVYAMTILNRWASDLLLFTTKEFDFFALPKNFCTGSSIMPQKQNYDVLEIMRANLAVTEAAQIEMQQIISKLFLGYNRDLQLVKAPLHKGLQVAMDTLEIALVIAPELKPNKDKLSAALTPELFATAEIFKRVKKGVSFRTAYGAVKKEIRR
ncbi:argininosuccinate lyase [Candidatus Peregrinibacteria bacterium]|nr:argininosuccinate lyase [Candidatus Peregrinibacteria bacterium]